MKSLVILLVIQSICYQSCIGERKKSNPDARKVVEDFYAWYIDTAYKIEPGYYQIPPFKKINNSGYIFDKVELSKRLSKIDYLSELFKNDILNKLEVCNQQMKKKKWDYEPEPQFNISECDYLWYDNWVGGQGENINGFNIIKETDTNLGFEFMVEILINKNVFAKSKVNVAKEGKAYKIVSIELVWN